MQAQADGNVRRVGIALVPDLKTLQDSVALSQQFKAHYAEGSSPLAMKIPGPYPHVLLTSFFMDTRRVEELSRELVMIVAALELPQGTLGRIMVHDCELFWEAEVPDTLRTFAGRIARWAGNYKAQQTPLSDFPNLTREQRASLDFYGYPYAGSTWRPRITLGRLALHAEPVLGPVEREWHAPWLILALINTHDVVAGVFKTFISRLPSS